MDDHLQAMARRYLARLRYMAKKRGLLPWIDATIADNKANRCVATEKEVRMLSRLCDDDGVRRADVPEILGKSYRQCVDDGDFGKIRRKDGHGTYDKVSAMLLALKDKKNKGKRK